MAMDLGEIDKVVHEYLRHMKNINKADSGYRLLGIRDNAAMREVDMAFKCFVPYLHPEKQHFTNWRAAKYQDLSLEDTTSCKAILLNFYNTWVKTKDDLKAHDKGLLTQVRWASLSASGVLTLSVLTHKNTHVLLDMAGLHRPPQPAVE